MTSPHPLSWAAPARQQTPPGAKPFYKGPYTSEMAPALFARLNADIPTLFAGLLEKLPDADGARHAELLGVDRLPVNVIGRTATHWVVDTAMQFDAQGQIALGLGLFDQPEAGRGHLWFYGGLRARLTQDQPDRHLLFPRQSVLIRKPPTLR